MKITFLGTGTSQGVPVIGCDCAVCRSLDFRDQRMRTSVHVAVGGKSLVIDTGPDFRRQMLNARVPTLDAVLFTHQHRDHTAGLDDVRPYNFRQGGELPIYGRREVLDQLRREYAYVFADERYPGAPRLEPREISNALFEAEGVPVLPVDVVHYRLPVFGFRIGNFSYVTDAGAIAETEKEKLLGSEVLVLNALRHEPHPSHFTLSQALTLVEELRPERAYFTHISHLLGEHRQVEKTLPEGVQLAYDGLVVEVND
ncbi:MAG: MBL fold metallo-hydrolase [Catalinimonas sp.]